MARILIVGCGCRGRRLARALIDRGHAVRGTTRHASRLDAIEAAGAEAVVADPGRLVTLIPSIEGVGVLCWLMGTAAGEPDAAAALQGPRLASMLEAIVDTPVRGVVYEASGTVDASRLREGAETVRRASETHRIPTEILERDPAREDEWLAAAISATEQVLAS